MDNASPHRTRLPARNLAENRITAIPRPTFSPDLAPSAFFLSAALNGQLSDRIFESPDEFVKAILEIASPIPRRHLREYFSNGKKDCSDVSTSMVPMSTKIYDGMIYSLHFLL
jgi:transposase